MKRHAEGFRQAFVHAVLAALVAFCCAPWSHAQGNGYERTFPQSKATVEKVLKEMQIPTAGRLPVLEGFALPADHPLDRYRRGYYESKFQVSPAPSSGSIVRVSVQVTAWYADPVAARSGYQLLTSNGRLEADLLDQLADQLAGKAPEVGATAPAIPVQGPPSSTRPPQTPNQAQPAISAPVPRLPEVVSGLSSSLAQVPPPQENSSPKAEQATPAEKDAARLQAEVDSLEEVLKSQVHPKDLVAVKQSGTPVVETASLTAKTLFLASAHDEFEMLDFNRDWVHVRISGLSRGWIWRDSLELPESVPDGDAPTGPGPVPVAADLFHVTREEDAPFPGDWAPLRGKNVKIVSVEKVNETEKDVSPQLRLEFAKSVLDKDYAELAQKPQELGGIVLIFDSADGGMIAATFPTLQQWKAGKLSDEALWHQCFFDPPETFNGSGSSASQ